MTSTDDPCRIFPISRAYVMNKDLREHKHHQKKVRIFASDRRGLAKESLIQNENGKSGFSRCVLFYEMYFETIVNR